MSRLVPDHATASALSRRPARRGVVTGSLAVGAAALLLAACGEPQGTRAPSPTPTPRPPSAAVARATGEPPVPLIAVLDHPFGTVSNTLRLLNAGGTEVASVPLSDGAEAVAMAGRRALIAGNGVIRALNESGGLTQVEQLAPAADTDLVRGLTAAPDGYTWVWTVLHRSADGALHSLVYLGAESAEPRLLIDRAAPDHALTPITWTGQTPIMSDDPVGIGGYILFRHSFGPSERIDTATGALSPLTADTCALSDVTAGGTTACVLDGREGPHGNGPVTVRVTSAGGSGHDVVLPAGAVQAGAAFFSPDGRHLTLASSPALANGAEVITAEVVDTATWQRVPLGGGLVPAAWLDNTRVIAVRDEGSLGGNPGMYVAALDGTLTRLGSANTVVGVARTS